MQTAIGPIYCNIWGGLRDINRPVSTLAENYLIIIIKGHGHVRLTNSIVFYWAVKLARVMFKWSLTSKWSWTNKPVAYIIRRRPKTNILRYIWHSLYIIFKTKDLGTPQWTSCASPGTCSYDTNDDCHHHYHYLYCYEDHCVIVLLQYVLPISPSPPQQRTTEAAVGFCSILRTCTMAHFPLHSISTQYLIQSLFLQNLLQMRFCSYRELQQIRYNIGILYAS